MFDIIKRPELILFILLDSNNNILKKKIFLRFIIFLNDTFFEI